MSYTFGPACSARVTQELHRRIYAALVTLLELRCRSYVGVIRTSTARVHGWIVSLLELHCWSYAAGVTRLGVTLLELCTARVTLLELHCWSYTAGVAPPPLLQQAAAPGGVQVTGALSANCAVRKVACCEQYTSLLFYYCLNEAAISYAVNSHFGMMQFPPSLIKLNKWVTTHTRNQFANN